MPPNTDMMKEILRLTQENNKMLRAMRRGAFIKTVVQMVVYVALLIAPIYFYLQYMKPYVDQMMHTVQQLQGTGAQAQAQFGSFEDMLKNLADKFKISSTSR